MRSLAPPWYSSLIVTEKGYAKPLIANVVTALRNDPAFTNAICFDALREEVMAMRPLPWSGGADYPKAWTDNDDRGMADWLQRHGLHVGLEAVAEGVQFVGAEAAYHPVLNYLESLAWDGEPRLDVWAVECFGCPDTPYTRAVAARWLISAVARVSQPGCQADHALVLEGNQGIGKSSVLRALATPWYTDEIAAIGSKDAAEQTIGVWIIELAELDAVTRAADVNHVKAFISRRKDRFRLSYGRRVQEHPRQCVFAATSNRTDWARDDTGGRRWWPIYCQFANVERIHELRDQLWAEAREAYAGGEAWWLNSAELIAAASVEQDNRIPEDPLSQQICSIVGAREWITTADVMEALGLPTERKTRAESMRIASILKRELGWERAKERVGGKPIWVYRVPTGT